MNRRAAIFLVLTALAVPAFASAQTTPGGSGIPFAIPTLEGREQMVPALKILALLTILSLAPAIVISMTSFTRIVIVLSFLKQGLGAQNAPPTQVVTALALLMTAVVMAPVASRIDAEAFSPYADGRIGDHDAYERTSTVAREWLLRHTREADVVLFYELAAMERPSEPSDVALHLLVPAFMISELRTGFEMGFLVFLPFVLVDLVVSAILTAMGMVMLPPTMISMPMKLLLFVGVDGWALLTRSLVASYS